MERNLRKKELYFSRVLSDFWRNFWTGRPKGGKFEGCQNGKICILYGRGDEDTKEYPGYRTYEGRMHSGQYEQKMVKQRIAFFSITNEKVDPKFRN